MRETIRFYLLFVLLLTLTFKASGQSKKPQTGKNKSAQSTNLTAEQIAERYLPSVVLIVCDDGKEKSSQGSGFFIKQGIVLTNHHVIEGMVRGAVKTVTNGKQSKEWLIEKILYTDEKNDLALLAIKEADKTITPILELATADLVKIGETVFVLSNPKGLTGTISQGIASSGIRKIDDANLLQIDAPISAGSSGGAVLNRQGKIIGIAIGSLSSGQNLNFAVPSAQIKLFLSDYEKSKTAYIFRAVGDTKNAWLKSEFSLEGEKNLTSGAESGRNEQQKAVTKPTLTETTKWLTEKLEKRVYSGQYVHKNEIKKIRDRIETLQFSQCTMNYKRRSANKEGNFEFSRIADNGEEWLIISEELYLTDLKTLTSVIYGLNGAGNYSVELTFNKDFERESHLYTNNSRKEIVAENKHLFGKYKENVLTISMNGEETAQRVTTAFQHLIKMCGENKKELF